MKWNKLKASGSKTASNHLEDSYVKFRLTSEVQDQAHDHWKVA